MSREIDGKEMTQQVGDHLIPALFSGILRTFGND